MGGADPAYPTSGEMGRGARPMGVAPAAVSFDILTAAVTCALPLAVLRTMKFYIQDRLSRATGHGVEEVTGAVRQNRYATSPAIVRAG